MKSKISIAFSILIFFIFFVMDLSYACTRVLHTFKNGKYVITGRSMDWYVRYPTSIWKFPRGMKRNGLTKENPLVWTSKYGSIVLVQTADGAKATASGMNEKGLVANLLYLSESDYGKRDPSKKGVAGSIFLQFLLDNFATVKEAVSRLNKGDIQYVPVPIPNSEHLPTMHISISDATGDSAIIEYLDGRMIIHHSKEFQVMTNSPPYDKQLALVAYWEEIGGHNFLPGTRKSPDRFVRAYFYNKELPEANTLQEAVAGVLSIIRNVSSPFGKTDPKKPNISTTLWRVVFAQKNRIMFYENTLNPNIIWVDFKKFDFSKDSKVKTIYADDINLVGDISDKLKPAEPFKFAAP